MPQHVLPESGWVGFPIRGDDDVPGALALFRPSYERAAAAATGPGRGTGARSETG